MTKTAKTKTNERASAGEKLGQKLLKSVQEMKAGAQARVTKVTPNPVAGGRRKTAPPQA